MNSVFIASLYDRGEYGIRNLKVCDSLDTAIKLCVEDLIARDFEAGNYHMSDERAKTPLSIKQKEYTEGRPHWEVENARDYCFWFIQEQQVLGAADSMRPELDIDAILALAGVGVNVTISDSRLSQPQRDTEYRRLLAHHYIGRQYHYDPKGDFGREIKHRGLKSTLAFYEIDEDEARRRAGKDEKRQRGGRNRNRKAVKGIKHALRQQFNHTVNALKEYEAA